MHQGAKKTRPSDRRVTVLRDVIVCGVEYPFWISIVSISRKISAGQDAESVTARIVLYSRLPRTLGCLCCGASLAVSGAVIQSVLENPLAAPNLIGINAGAGLAVALHGAFFSGAAALAPLSAFLGALAGAFTVLLIGESTGASRLTVILSGIAVAHFFKSLP